MYKVAIVEDDYMISMLNRNVVEKDSRFQVVKEFSSGKKALSWLSVNPVDLIILDVYMPRLTGPELLRELRMQGSQVDVIVVTAAHDTKTLSELLKLGIVDYLVKPFTPQRFQQALDHFFQQRVTLQGQQQVKQQDIDKIFVPRISKESIPKGLQEKTLEKIRKELTDTEEQTCEHIALKAGLSVVTARRYLNFMLETGEAESRINYDTGGRPSVVYWLRKESSPYLHG